MSGTITGITPQKRNPNRVNISLDGDFRFSLQSITAGWLQNGQFLSEEDIQQLIQKDTREVVYQSALRLLGYKARTVAEVRKRLVDKGFPEGSIEEVLEKLKENHLLDDRQYAQLWTEDRAVYHPRSRRMMRWELLGKGVAQDEVEAALSTVCSDEDLAYGAANKAIKRWKNLPVDDFRKKCSDFLARKGFSYDIVRLTVARLIKELTQ
jgi:regulatory protein